jgi:trimeric autotransporter adhesin
MTTLQRLSKTLLLTLMIVNAGAGLAQRPAASPPPAAQTASTPVIGSGTPEQLVKWTGVSGQNSFAIGNSIITETKFGLIGIGTLTPSSKLSVAGMIETTLGGYKFPDGTVQTTAGLSSVFHDLTLIGNGTQGSPLGIAPGGVGTLQLANQAVTAQKLANGSVVRSFNGLFDNIQLAAGANITITPAGNTLTIAAPNALSAVAHDATLTGNGTSASVLAIANAGVSAQKLNTTAPPLAGQLLGFDGSSLAWQTLAGFSGITTDATLTGNGTSGSPLKIASPLTLEGNQSGFDAILNIRNLGDGTAISARGGDSFTESGGEGLLVFGGSSDKVKGGLGIISNGGNSNSGLGGNGLLTSGGDSNTGEGGVGISARGGFSEAGQGGIGLFLEGGIGAPGGAALVARRGGGRLDAAEGLAGDFEGDVLITGALNVTGTKNFKIDHPLDPQNKYLYHAAIESSEVLNLYSGNVTTDAGGEAAITLPDWFEAINSDLRYQLTVVGQFAQAIVADEVKNNRFTIKTSAPHVKVSWQVTGVRSDAAMKKHPFTVVEAKPESERGHYLTPEAFNQREEKSLRWARYPELMKQIKERDESFRLKPQNVKP